MCIVDYLKMTSNQHFWDSLIDMLSCLTVTKLFLYSSSCTLLLFCLTFPVFSLDPRGRVKNASRVTSHVEWPIISHCEGHQIPKPALVPTHFANPPPPLLPPSLCYFFSPPSSFSPECLARRHQHPALNEKDLLKFIRGWRLWGPVGLPATFLPFQHRTRETEQREQPFIWAFYGPILPSLAPGTRGYRILLKRTISLIEHGVFGKAIENTTMAFLRVILASLHQATESHAPV